MSLEGASMSRVRYVNKKTGWVSIYESTPYYDPVTKASRPKRKYIGYEDPITKEFVPSSGKPGRKKHDEIDTSATGSSPSMSQANYKRVLAELDKQRDENLQLQKKITVLQEQIEKLSFAFDSYVGSVQNVFNTI